ncbi:SRPBCC family protein [Sanguibacter antarcticus]|uniref:Polyketide cyclase/dehydrase/lipid transport protein n=1 Tax=Sanguibacter antarcticus TaxID=372484 RepID=A0A2A9E1Q2_9MICO|nr:SRPBCC family protein [Sanguibacter antarcticus]PFG32295.1 polyketide cyclase/dehydrase/lipid transport protein [Sanguibacter antarcticus]
MPSERSRALRFAASVTVPLPAADAFALVADVRNHDRWIPLTHGRFPVAPPGPLPRGARFTMISTPGIVDRMIVTDLIGTASTTLSTTFRKAGPLLAGVAGIEVTPGPTARTSQITWWEDVHLAGPIPARVTRVLVGPFLVLMLRYALRAVSREIAATAAARG